jgi:hypothetical protein
MQRTHTHTHTHTHTERQRDRERERERQREREREEKEGGRKPLLTAVLLVLLEVIHLQQEKYKTKEFPNVNTKCLLQQ